LPSLPKSIVSAAVQSTLFPVPTCSAPPPFTLTVHTSVSGVAPSGSLTSPLSVISSSVCTLWKFVGLVMRTDGGRSGGGSRTVTLTRSESDAPCGSVPLSSSVRVPSVPNTTSTSQPVAGNALSAGSLLVQVKALHASAAPGSFRSNEVPRSTVDTPWKISSSGTGFVISTRGAVFTTVTSTSTLVRPPSLSTAVTVITRGPTVAKTSEVARPVPSSPSRFEVHVTSQHAMPSSKSSTSASKNTVAFSSNSSPGLGRVTSTVGGTSPSTEPTAPRASTTRPTFPSGLALALASRTSSTSPALWPGSAAHTRAATPAANGEEKLVPCLMRTTLAGALGSGPSQSENGANRSTCSEPKLEPAARAKEFDATPPTQITPAFSHGVCQVFSNPRPTPKSGSFASASTSLPALPAEANRSIPDARTAAVAASNGRTVKPRRYGTGVE